MSTSTHKARTAQSTEHVHPEFAAPGPIDQPVEDSAGCGCGGCGCGAGTDEPTQPATETVR